MSADADALRVRRAKRLLLEEHEVLACALGNPVRDDVAATYHAQASCLRKGAEGTQLRERRIRARLGQFQPCGVLFPSLTHAASQRRPSGLRRFQIEAHVQTRAPARGGRLGLLEYLEADRDFKIAFDGKGRADPRADAFVGPVGRQRDVQASGLEMHAFLCFRAFKLKVLPVLFILLEYVRVLLAILRFGRCVNDAHARHDLRRLVGPRRPWGGAGRECASCLLQGGGGRTL